MSHLSHQRCKHHITDHSLNFDGNISSCGLIILFRFPVIRWKCGITSQMNHLILASNSHVFVNASIKYWISPATRQNLSPFSSAVERHNITEESLHLDIRRTFDGWIVLHIIRQFLQLTKIWWLILVKMHNIRNYWAQDNRTFWLLWILL